MRYALLLLSFLLISSAPYALEATPKAQVAIENTKVTSRASGLLDHYKDIYACEKQSLFFAPGHPEADADGCVKATVSCPAGSVLVADESGGWECGCKSPFGGYLRNGESVVAYKQRHKCDRTCEQETRVCQQGVLTGSLTEPSCQAVPTHNIDNISVPRDIKWAKVGTDRYRVGTIGNNYWRHGCGRFNRHVEFNIHDASKVKQFDLVWVGWDDYAKLWVNRDEVANLPVEYGTRIRRGRWYRRTPCELRTSWQAHIRGPIYRHYMGGYAKKNMLPHLKDGKNTIDMSVIVAGAGEGWFDFIIKSDPVCPQ